MVERMREARGSIPRISIIIVFFITNQSTPLIPYNFTNPEANQRPNPRKLSGSCSQWPLQVWIWIHLFLLTTVHS